MGIQDHFLVETRRDFFRNSLGGVGAIALAHLMAQDGLSFGRLKALAGTASEQKQEVADEQKQEVTDSDEMPVLRSSRR